ncbi:MULTISPECIES: hypothetical protein [unclassified Brevundimonas]|uniref:hypothetical protein n=1 Tax=unclassified Brevundimonas TaxID=2622653 RepID=UPI0025BDD62A|nr:MULTISPECIES: hypothetical protein [unclassified Brevundimonas]
MDEFIALDERTPLHKIPVEIRKFFGSTKYQLQVLYGALEVYELICEKYNLSIYPNKSHIHMSSARSVIHELSTFMKLAHSVHKYNKETNKYYVEYIKSNPSIKNTRDSLAHYYERINTTHNTIKINTMKISDGKFHIINKDGLSYSSIKLDYEIYQNSKRLVENFYLAIIDTPNRS